MSPYIIVLNRGCMENKITFTKDDFVNQNFFKELPPTIVQKKHRIEKTRWGLFRCLNCGTFFKVNLYSAYKHQTRYCCHKCSATCHHDVEGGNEEHQLYSRWLSMRQRCFNPTSTSYKRYGARGITVEPYLLDFGNYVQYVSSLGGYQENLPRDIQLDRIDNSKGYERGNLRWVDQSTNVANTRKRSDGMYSEYKGITYSTIHHKYIARVHFKGKTLTSRTFNTELEAVKYRDQFIIENNLPHTLNLIERATTIPQGSTSKQMEVPSTQIG